ncbi:MAG: ABC transporter ATP-binding protein/permease [Oscillospiraceae bacterium]|nr:ABC transporter ATP-binding protein/permease [Oscillospiraceae bacterium]
MKTLFRYLRPFSLLLILCIVLLFFQALCDLSLPDLMSNIINVGIQADGVNPGAPELLSKDAMEFISFFLSQSDSEEFADAYSISSGENLKPTAIGKKFSFDEIDDIYILKKNHLESVDSIYTSSISALIITVQHISEMQSPAAMSTPMVFSETDGFSTITASQLYSVKMMLSMLPPEMLEDIIESSSTLDPVIISQVASIFTKIFYVELGVDFNMLQREYILSTSFQMLGLALLATILSVVIGYIASRVGATLSRNLRKDIFEKVIAFSNQEIDKFSTASLITRTTNDVSQIQMLIMMSIRMAFYSPIMGIGGVLKAQGKSSSLTYIIVIALVLILGIVLLVFTIALPKFKLQQKLIDRVNLISRENLAGIMVIRAFGNETHEQDRFDVANTELTTVNRFVQRTMSLLFPSMMLIMNIIILIILWVGSNAIAASTMNVGNVIAFIQYSMQIIMSFLMISALFVIFPRASVSINRVSEVLETELSIVDPKQPKAINIEKTLGQVDFVDVSFRYSNAESNAIEHVTFTAEPGEITAIIGSTGAGKTTLVNLIPRLYDVTDGQILIDGVDLRELSQINIREMIGYVAQKGVLFSGDIASNIRYGKQDASDKEIDTAIKVAQAADFVTEREGGIHAEIARGGTNVSGGQKQRISIARALVKQPHIYIFDDTFSALDFKTDAALREALSLYCSDATVIIVAQRIGTIMHSDKIIVLDGGRIIGEGKHEELLKHCGTYREIAETQLSKEELL